MATVGPYLTEFLSRWPTVGDLAAADLDDVLHCWQGLGYYARARNLHKCAGVVSSQYNGHCPEDEAALLSLPGIGPYTAAAIRAIAFDKRAVVVDGNVERVMGSSSPIHALACFAGQTHGPLCGLAKRDHATADHCGDRRALFFRIPFPVADCW